MKLATLTPLAVVVGLLVASAAQATTIRGFTTKGMVQEAAVVVRARVIDRVSVWNGDKTKIYTDSTLKVGEVITGKALSSAITVRQLGGSVDGVTMHVEGVAPIARGEQVVLFLRTDGARFYLVGMAQGKLRVETLRDGREVVTRTISGLKTVQVGKRIGPAPERARTPEAPEEYSAFAARIRGYARELKERSR